MSRTERALFAVAALVASLFVAAPARAVECDRIEFDGNRYVTCAVDPESEELHLFLRDPQGEIWGDFSTLDTALDEDAPGAFAAAASAAPVPALPTPSTDSSFHHERH